MNIEDLRIGDEVITYDFSSNQIHVNKISRLIRHETMIWIHIRTSDLNTITATRFHPFWVENQDAWIQALDLEPGMELRQPSGAVVRVTDVSITTLDSPQTTYNLEVDDAHDYFAGPSHVLVHNDSPSPNQLVGPQARPEATAPGIKGSAHESAKAFQLEHAKTARRLLKGTGVKIHTHTANPEGDPTVQGDYPHAHGKDASGKDWSVNIDGSVHDAKTSKGTIPNDVRETLQDAGWGC